MSRALGPADRFFFYGTLLDPDIRQRVIGREVKLLSASLAGFRRVRVGGKWYPMLVPGLAGDRVGGALATGLTKTEIARLISYEDDTKYALRRVSVLLESGRRMRALVFLPLKGLRPSAEAWDLALWQQREKPRVMRLKLWP